MPCINGCRKAGKQHPRMQEVAYEKEEQPFLNHADMPTEDERHYDPAQVGLCKAAVKVGKPTHALSK